MFRSNRTLEMKTTYSCNNVKERILHLLEGKSRVVSRVRAERVRRTRERQTERERETQMYIYIYIYQNIIYIYIYFYIISRYIYIYLYIYISKIENYHSIFMVKFFYKKKLKSKNPTSIYIYYMYGYVSAH